MTTNTDLLTEMLSQWITEKRFRRLLKNINNMDLEKHIHSLEKTLAELTIENQKLREDYSKMSVDEIEKINKEQLKEMAHFYGGWESLQEVVQNLKDNADEEAGERAMNEPDAWAGGFAENH